MNATVTRLSPALEQALAAALAVERQPGVRWLLGDDLCDCIFQRIGEWTNPYLAQTLRVRLCCLWEELYRAYPQHVQRLDAYYDHNRDAYVAEPREWDSEDAAMPRYLWYRQLARRTGKGLADIRREYAGREAERPRPVPAGASRRAVQPSPEERQEALRRRQVASGWLLPGEPVVVHAGNW